MKRGGGETSISLYPVSCGKLALERVKLAFNLAWKKRGNEPICLTVWKKTILIFIPPKKLHSRLLF